MTCLKIITNVHIHVRPLFASLLMGMINTLSIGSWNINGLGDKYRDEFFLSCLKYDINILLETWKGADSNLNLSEFKTLQKM